MGVTSIRLKHLLQDLNPVQINADPDLEVGGLSYDSRRIKQGDLFVAIKGFQTDGHLFVGQAKAAGAAAAVLESELEDPGLPAVRVADSRYALSIMANRYFDFPSRKLTLIGVTGTNGKTTVTHLIWAMLSRRTKAGLIGTVVNRLGEKTSPAHHTTPESLDLQELLAQMAEDGAKAAVMEVSSHALALKRVAGCEFDLAVFTNLTQDHLDFHPDMEDYYLSKKTLFTGLPRSGRAVVNLDDPYGARLAGELAPAPILGFGIQSPAADLQAEEISLSPQGLQFTASWQGEQFRIQSPLTGKFNVYNCLAAAAAGLAAGLTPAEVVGGLAEVDSVPGRFERVPAELPFTVIIDYAHTPDGLQNVLQTARELTVNRVITVFGCGGDRDRRKRPLMGEAAGSLSDYSVVTSDNPRGEDPARIIAEIIPGLLHSQGQYQVEIDRRQAIKKALFLAQPGDIVVIAGKGHETYQIIGDQVLPFDDREVAREVAWEIARDKGVG